MWLLLFFYSKLFYNTFAHSYKKKFHSISRSHTSGGLLRSKKTAIFLNVFLWNVFHDVFFLLQFYLILFLPFFTALCSISLSFVVRSRSRFHKDSYKKLLFDCVCVLHLRRVSVLVCCCLFLGVCNLLVLFCCSIKSLVWYKFHR